MEFRKYQLILEFEEANRPLTQIEKKSLASFYRVFKSGAR